MLGLKINILDYWKKSNLIRKDFLPNPESLVDQILEGVGKKKFTKKQTSLFLGNYVRL